MLTTTCIKFTPNINTTEQPGSLHKYAYSTRLSTIGDRSFPVAAARVWNSLPHHVARPHLLWLYFEVVWRLISSVALSYNFILPHTCSSRAVTARHFGHLNRSFTLLLLTRKNVMNRLPIYTVGRRAFFVAGARVWNDLPADVTSAASLSTFRKRLKLHLFPLSYPGLVL